MRKDAAQNKSCSSNRIRFMEPYQHKAQYYETDQMNVIHHSNYIRWFEEARSYFLEQIGFPYDVLEHEMKLISPVMEITCKYRAMVRFGDLVDIYTSVEKFNGIKLTLSYKIVNHKTGELCTTGTSTHCFLNASGTPVSLKKSAPNLYQKILEHLEAAPN